MFKESEMRGRDEMLKKAHAPGFGGKKLRRCVLFEQRLALWHVGDCPWRSQSWCSRVMAEQQHLGAGGGVCAQCLGGADHVTHWRSETGSSGMTGDRNRRCAQGTEK